MGLIEHAKRELTLIGYNEADTDDDPNKWMYDGLIELIDTFAKQGHSGGSAEYCISTLNKLLRFKNLSPLKKKDFIEVAEDIFQCSRCSEMFLTKDKTQYYSVHDKSKLFDFEEKK